MFKIKNKVISIVLSTLLAAVFFAAGLFKLTGAEKMVAVFSELGPGQWFRYVVGILEISISVVLFMPAYRTLAAKIATLLIVGTVVSHLFFISGSSLPALIFFMLASLFIYFDTVRRTNTSGVTNE